MRGLRLTPMTAARRPGCPHVIGRRPRGCLRGRSTDRLGLMGAALQSPHPICDRCLKSRSALSRLLPKLPRPYYDQPFLFGSSQCSGSSRFARRGPLALAAILGAAFVIGTVGAAINRSGDFDSVAYDLTITVSASRSQGMDSALEAVEGHRPSGLTDLERFVVVVPANIASSHRVILH